MVSGNGLYIYSIAFAITSIITFLEYILQSKYSHTHSLIVKCWFLYLYSGLYGLWSCLLLFVIRFGIIPVEKLFQLEEAGTGSVVDLDYSNPYILAIVIGLLAKSISKLNIIQIGRYPIGFETVLRALEEQLLTRLRSQINTHYTRYFNQIIQYQGNQNIQKVEDLDSETELLKTVAKDRLPHILLNDEENKQVTIEIEIEAIQYSPAVLTYFLNNFGQDNFTDYIAAVIAAKNA